MIKLPVESTTVIKAASDSTLKQFTTFGVSNTMCFLHHYYSGAHWGGWGPSPPQDLQNNINFFGFIDSMFKMYMDIKL